MRKLKLLFLLVSCNFIFLNAQIEFLSPVGSNTALFQYENNAKSEFVYNNIIIRPDTLNLPFVDEFSSNSLRPYDFTSTQITDTIAFAAGTCVTTGDFDMQEAVFSTSTTYTYFFDVPNQVIDSLPNSPIQVNYFDADPCFPVASSQSLFWPLAYTYSFDSITGAKLDSVLMSGDTTLMYAEIYFGSLSLQSKWVDNYAYHNTTFPINPPTIGVVTLDGLNEFGRPYNNDVINPVGPADVLTSKPINLSGLMNDSAVFISFFVQAQGLGDFPNSTDSLVLEFKNEYEDQWIKVWGITSADVPTDNFKQFYVAVRDTNLVTGPRYFYEDFQFRFRNIASLSGNNDHWHIDYVRLDKNRSFGELDTVIRDVAFLYDFPNFLATYSTLPWSQFQAGADEFAAEISIPIRDNGQVNGVSAGSFPISVLITDSLDTDTIFKLSGLNFNATSEFKNQVFTPISEFVKPSFSGDSICINAGMAIYPTARNLLLENDTIFSQICLNKVMAYDDGSAERTYGVSGSPEELKKFAYEFNVAHPDTLAAIQVHFSNIDQNVADLVFNFYAWDSIEVGPALSYENIIGSIENAKPTYVDKVNGFVTFAFDTPILVTDKFYIGWAQTDSRNLQIGFDLNSTKGKSKMFTYVASTWQPTSISEEGSPMIRALLDADFPFNPPTSIKNPSFTKEVVIYPNPTNHSFTVKLDANFTNFELNLYDVTGKLLLQNGLQDSYDVSSLSEGIYWIYLKIDGLTYTAKLVKK